MRILLIGAPGAGKGTQAEKLANFFKIPRLTTGDLLRQAIQEGTPLGKKVEAILEQGSLVSDPTILELMEERMAKPDAANGFVLDGFPRTVGQAEGLEKWLAEKKWKLDHVIALNVSDSIAVERITGRRQCRKCGAAYHLRFNPPKKEGRCDACGSSLTLRRDDEETTVRHRLRVYTKETAPLVSFYEKKGLLKQVDGSRGPEQIFDALCSLIK